MSEARKIFDWAATDREFPPIVGRGRGVPMHEPAMDLQDYIECRRAIHELPEVEKMPEQGQTASPLPTPITVVVAERFVFTQAQRKTTTTVSDFVVPANHPIVVDGQTQHPTEPYRVAVEPDGNGVYPILESVFRETYEVVESQT